MKIVRNEIVERLSEADNRSQFFKADGRDICKAGDLVVVETIINMATGKTSSFAGICIAIHRSGPTTSITVRNIILKVGVEQKFRVYSPLVKSITRISPGEGFRRVKLYYLREQPKKARIGELKDIMEKKAAEKKEAEK